MTALISDLTGSGMPVQMAAYVGWPANKAVTASGTAQLSDSAALTAGNLLQIGPNTITTAGGATAIQIPSTMPINASLLVNVTSSTTALLFPPSSGTINGGNGNASINVAQNKPTLVVRLSSTVFVAIIGA